MGKIQKFIVLCCLYYPSRARQSSTSLPLRYHILFSSFFFGLILQNLLRFFIFCWPLLFSTTRKERVYLWLNNEQQINVLSFFSTKEKKIKSNQIKVKSVVSCMSYLLETSLQTPKWDIFCYLCFLLSLIFIFMLVEYK